MSHAARIKTAIAALRQEETIRWTLILAAASVGIIATFSGFTGLAGLAFASILFAAVFTMLLHAMVIYTARGFANSRGVAARAPWLIGWGATSAVSIAMGFGFFFSMVGSAALAEDSVNSANAKLLAPTTTVVNAYSAVAASARDLAEHSRKTAEEEIKTGGTCSDGNHIADEGPRRRFRTRQSEIFGSYEAHFAARAGELRRIIDGASLAVAEYDSARHARTVMQLRRAYAEAAALSSDPRLVAWRRQLNASQAELAGVITDPTNGTRFICPDPVFSAKLAAAASVSEVRGLSPEPPPIEEPGHAASVRRGVELITGRAKFDVGKDGTALALGSIVDISILLLVLMGARERDRNNPRPQAQTRTFFGGPRRPPDAAGVFAGVMGQPRTISAEQRQRLEQLLKHGDYVTELMLKYIVFDRKNALLIVPLDGRAPDRQALSRLAIALFGLGVAEPYAARGVDRSMRGWEDQIDALPGLKGATRFQPYRINLRLLADLQLDLWRTPPDGDDDPDEGAEILRRDPWPRPSSPRASNDGADPGQFGT